MWIWIETAGSSAAGGGAILFLAIAMLAVLFISPFAGVFIAIRSFKKKEYIVGIISLLVAVACTGYLIGSYVSSKKEQKEYNRESDRLSVDFTNKENVDGEPDRFIFSFDFENNTIERIIGTDIEVVVLNFKGEELIKTNISELDIVSGQKKSYSYSVIAGDELKSDELYNTAYRYLELQITIKMLDYNDRGDNYYFSDHRVLKRIDLLELEKDYINAVGYYDEGKYQQAIDMFSQTGNYKDSSEYLNRSYAAIERIEEDEKTRLKENVYSAAMELYEQGRYSEAIDRFNEIIGYRDSEKKIEECKNAIELAKLENEYIMAIALYEQKNYSEAYRAFYDIADYKDSEKYMTAILDEVNDISEKYAAEGNYREAYNVLSDMGYSTSQNSANYLPILKAYSCASYGDYKGAVENGLTCIVIPYGTEEIGGFMNCKGLISVIMPDTVTSIKDDAFSGCTDLKKLELSPNIKTIGMGAFSNCDSLEKIVLPVALESVSVKGMNSFDGDIYYAGTVEQWESVKKEHAFMTTFSKTVYCIDGNVKP